MPGPAATVTARAHRNGTALGAARGVPGQCAAPAMVRTHCSPPPTPQQHTSAAAARRTRAVRTSTVRISRRVPGQHDQDQRAQDQRGRTSSERDHRQHGRRDQRGRDQQHGDPPQTAAAPRRPDAGTGRPCPDGPDAPPPGGAAERRLAAPGPQNDQGPAPASSTRDRHTPGDQPRPAAPVDRDQQDDRRDDGRDCTDERRDDTRGCTRVRTAAPAARRWTCAAPVATTAGPAATTATG